MKYEYVELLRHFSNVFLITSFLLILITMQISTAFMTNYYVLVFFIFYGNTYLFIFLPLNGTFSLIISMAWKKYRFLIIISCKIPLMSMTKKSSSDTQFRLVIVESVVCRVWVNNTLLHKNILIFSMAFIFFHLVDSFFIQSTPSVFSCFLISTVKTII